jgi:hypothetical protein
MRKGILILPALLLMVAAPSLAGELWKKKPVGAWSRQGTVEFFRNSPWVRRVSVAGRDPSGFSRSAFGGPGLSANMCPSCTGLQPPREKPTAAGSGTQSASGTDGAGVYFIQWTSAKIVRQAISHMRALDGLTGVEDVSVLPTYLLTVVGTDLSVFDGVSEADLKAATYLLAKRADNEVKPLRVTTHRQPDGRIASILFEFPREIKGEPAVGDQEKSVEFCCKLKNFMLRTTFNPSKMTTGDGRDL